MGSGTFRGGIHPYDGKELSRDRAIQDIRPGKELAYLVSQHIGAPAKPIVKKGDRVLVGQMIAEAGGFVSAPVYASVSGVVKGIEKRLTATGGYCDAIIVENDELYESVAFEETKDITQNFRRKPISSFRQRKANLNIRCRRKNTWWSTGYLIRQNGK